MVETETFISEHIDEIRNTVGDGKAIIALSGGVDSSVAAVLAHKAIGDRLVAVFVNDGLMRENEADRVKEMFVDLGINVQIVDAQDEFFNALRGKADPEEKRKAFRDMFYKTFGRLVRESSANYLIQGTIAADIDETKRGVKTQHNILEQIGIDPETYGFKVIEPLRELYKDGVREIARALNLPSEISERMPFPGPGLATRVLGEVTPERVDVVRKATTIVEQETKDLGMFQAFAVLMCDRATGLSAESGRDFGDIIIVRAVNSKNALTASPTEITWEKLKRIQERIVSEIAPVNRVVYDITPKPPATIEYI